MYILSYKLALFCRFPVKIRLYLGGSIFTGEDKNVHFELHTGSLLYIS